MCWIGNRIINHPGFVHMLWKDSASTSSVTVSPASIKMQLRNSRLRRKRASRVQPESGCPRSPHKPPLYLLTVIVALVPCCFAADVTITINPEVRYQRIDGFGSASASTLFHPG